MANIILIELAEDNNTKTANRWSIEERQYKKKQWPKCGANEAGSVKIEVLPCKTAYLADVRLVEGDSEFIYRIKADITSLSLISGMLPVVNSTDLQLTKGDVWSAATMPIASASCRAVLDAVPTDHFGKLCGFIRDSYENNPCVLKIYASEDEDEFKVTLIITMDRFDRLLMKELLSVEYDIRKEHPAVPFAFSFIPKRMMSDTNNTPLYGEEIFSK